jgi:putative Mn2+ efflux pump MntP
MWWKSFFTIGFILEPMEIMLMVHGTGFTSRMSTYAPYAYHMLKEFIWTQLGLWYTMNRIYDKHKEIRWAWVNAGEWMTHDDSLRFQDIAYLDWKHKKGKWCLHRNLTLSI